MTIHKASHKSLPFVMAILLMPSIQRNLITIALLLLPRALPAAALEPQPTPLELISPADYQVFQRADATEGKIIIHGSAAENIGAGFYLEASLTGPGAEDRRQKLPFTKSDGRDFKAVLNAPAGGWYRFTLRLRSPAKIVAEQTVAHVGVGEIFVIAGQSNAANHGEERQQTKSGLVSVSFSYRWKLANDPHPGASGDGGSFIPPFGDALAARFKVPIGIIATGVGATSVREWLPHGARFPNPPTLTNHVKQLADGQWEARGAIFSVFSLRLKDLGPRGFRAVLWHQGESDANQRDTTRTLAGDLYRKFLLEFITASRREVGWDFPWFVAQVSYHSPDDPGSPDIRAAQASLWNTNGVFPGPDTDALAGDFRDHAGNGIHFSGKGLREHAACWVEKVAPWLEQQLASATPPPPATNGNTKPSGPPPKLVLPLAENFTVNGRPVFIFLPPESKRQQPQPWIFYAPTLPGYPDEAERWMHEQFLAAGIAVAGVDVGEAYGSPKSHAVFDALYHELTEKRGFAKKPCLFGRSRGGLWVSSWAIAHPDRVAGIIGIYPVFDFRTYPGLTNAAAAYGLTPAELDAHGAELNPIERIETLARAHVPIMIIHGDADKVVPLKQNSAELMRRYRSAGAEKFAELITLEGQGHSFYEGFFHSQRLVDFAIACARGEIFQLNR